MGELLAHRPCSATPRASWPGLREEGFIKPSIRSTPRACWTTWRRSSSRPRHETFDFTARLDARAVQARSTTPAGRSWSIGLKLNLPPEYLLIHRVWLGGIGVLCQLEGEVPVLDVLAEWLPNFDVDAVDEFLLDSGGDAV